MMRNRFFRKKDRVFSALDIGTEAVKVLIFRKTERINILGSSLEYFDENSKFDSQDFSRDVLKKTIFQALKKAKKESGRESEDISLSLPANILRAKVIFHSLKRKNLARNISKKEEEEISQQILIKAQKEISQKTLQKYGILPDDLQLVSLEILEIKIDGYGVKTLSGYRGENLDFRILVTFLPKYYLQDFYEIIYNLNSKISNNKVAKDIPNSSKITAKKILKILRITHEAQNLIAAFEKPNALFLDIGGEISQIFLINNGKLKIVDYFNTGAKEFSKAISKNLGLPEQSARMLKERYSKGELSEDTRKRIKEILWPACQTWFIALKNKLKEGKDGGLLPPGIYIF